MTTNNDLEKHKIYTELAKERDNSKSETLRNLLNEELCSYVELSNTYADFVKLYQHVFNKHNELRGIYISEPIENIKQIEDKKVAKVIFECISNRNEALNVLEDFYIYLLDLSTENYYKAISRDFKDWSEFIKTSCEMLVDTVIGATPGMAEFKAIYDNFVKINELVTELEKSEIDYSETDRKLLEIETHIQAMSGVNQFYLQSMRILREGLQI